MPQTGTWIPYAGGDALLLAAILFVIAGALAYLGTRLQHPVGTQRPGRALGILLVLIWVLALATLVFAVGSMAIAQTQQRGNLSAAPNPITQITELSAILTFAVITSITADHGLKTAFGSAIVGAIAAPMIFELPFDLIVMPRIYYMSRIYYTPLPAIVYTLLFFLPLFLWELSSFALLTLSPVARLSKYSLFALAAMFFVFAIWALFGFPFPGSPIPITLNAVSKILSFVAVITLFLPQKRMLADKTSGQ